MTQVHVRDTRLYDIQYRDGDIEFRVPRDRIIFLSRPKVIDVIVETEAPMTCTSNDLVSDLTHDDVMDPEMSELLDFTQDVKY